LQHPSITGINVIVESGLVSYKLNKLAKEKAADLIVMGIDNERSFVKEHVLGSTSIEEARSFKIPVLIVPVNAECRKFKSIAFACDYKYAPKEVSALIQVKYYTTLFEGKLNIVHVLEPEHQISLKEAKSDKFIEDTLEKTEHKTFFVYEKNASEGILEFVKTHEIDLVIVEPQHHGFFERIFSKSTTKELAFHLNVPLLALHS
jgi:nucleotide-binding universal stress UspA family protein